MQLPQSPANAALVSEMHSATRSEHTNLNKAITARLPLALPSHASNPYFYAAGMTVFAQMYFAMESTWNQLLKEHGSNSLSERHRDILLTLKTGHLDRTQRLESDLRNLQASMNVASSRSLERLQAEALRFQQDISEILLANPHLVIAYAWPMYLALFNGGRWIAKQLLAAGPDFWGADTDDTAQDYLSFWYFDDSVYDEHHGDSVKIDFKQRLNAVPEQLTQSERDEVVLEVKRVFGICTEMIALLDEHALTLERERQELRLKTSQQHSKTGWFASMTPVSNAWQSLRAVVGYASAPASLRKDFDQHA